MLLSRRRLQGEVVTQLHTILGISQLLLLLTGCWDLFLFFFLFGTTNKEVRGWVWEGNYLSGDTVIELHHPWKERLEEGWMGVRCLKPLSLL